MKYVPMQTGMWTVFSGSFRKNLKTVFDPDPKTAQAVTTAAKKQYRQILRRGPQPVLPEYGLFRIPGRPRL